MSDEASFKSREKTRLCPSCRMSISVLATKCRFCGENVGRPKDETRNLSIQDLGGETIVHYAPSSNVMEALEAFRAEETATKTPPPQKRSLFRRKAKAPNETESQNARGGLPELDARSKALASLAMPVRPTVHAVPKPSWMKRTVFLGMTIAAAIILYFGSVEAYAIIRGWGNHNEKPTYVNSAPGIMSGNGNPVEALKAASDALNHDNSPENREVMEQSYTYISDRIHKILQSPRITLSALQEASNLANQGRKVAPGPAMTALCEEVYEENNAYLLRVVSTDVKSNPPKATLRFYDGKTADVKVGDTVWKGRFTVMSIKADGTVNLRDSKRTVPPRGAERIVAVTLVGIPN